MEHPVAIVTHVGSALACLVLAAVVLAQNPYKRAHVSFAALAANLAAWAVGVSLVVAAGSAEEARRWIHVSFLAACFLPFTFSYFAGVVPGHRYEGPRWLLLAQIAIVPLLVAGSFTQWYLRDVTLPASGPPRATYGPVFVVFAAVVVLTMAAAFPTLIRRWRRATGLEKRQLAHVIFGIVVFSFLATFTNVVLPVLGLGELEAYGPVFIAGMLTIFAYAMVRYHLLDVRVLISRTTVYLVGTVFIVLTFFAAIATVHWALRMGTRVGPIVSTLLAALVIALVLEPLKSRVELLMNRTLLKRRYDVNELLARASRNASQIMDLDLLLKTVSDDIHRTVGVTAVRVFLLDERDPDACLLAYSTRAEDPQRTWEHRELLEFLRRNPRPLVLEQLVHNRVSVRDARLAKHLAELEAFLCVPLVSKSGLAGILTLGEKVSRDMYSAEDVGIFSALSHPLVAAVENARLYRKLEEANVYRERILSTMRGGVIAVDAEGRVTLINEAARDIVGPVELGEPYGGLPDPVVRVIERTLDSEDGVQDYEAPVHTASNSEVPVTMSSAPLPGESGAPSGAVVMIYDISRVKRLEQNVQRAHRLSSIGTMAAGMAHEIKNPLVSIKTFTQLLLNRYEDADFRQTFSDVVPHEVERIDTIVSQLLDFARPRPTKFDDLDVRDIVNKVVRLVENQARKKDVELVVDLPEDSLDIRGDEQQLHQVFLNLVLNAIDAMSHTTERRLTILGEKARMHLRRNGHVPMLDVLCARVVICDTGCGIAPEELDGIFTPFFTTKEFGTGLGLSVVHGIVTEHGGQIDVESAPGRGTTFTVSLPAAPVAATAGNGT